MLKSSPRFAAPSPSRISAFFPPRATTLVSFIRCRLRPSRSIIDLAAFVPRPGHRDRRALRRRSHNGRYEQAMLWVAALLAFILWVLGWSSGFLGPVVHIFLLVAILAILAALLPQRLPLRGEQEEHPADQEPPAVAGE